MILTEACESRVNGYLYLLERSLDTGLPRASAREAVREIESHLRERIAGVTATDERAALEQILTQLGPPLRVAQAYAAERILDEAVLTGRVIPMARAIWHVAVTSAVGFITALGLATGYLVGTTFLLLAALKPIFPNNVGFWVVNGAGSLPTSLGVKFSPIEAPAGGNWVIVLGLVVGVGVLALTHRSARTVLRRWRERRPLSPARII